MSKIYKPYKRFRFEYEDETLETTGVYSQEHTGFYVLEWEETEKNGQEDTHIGGMMLFDGVKFVPVDDSEWVDEYRFDGWLEGLAEFFSKNNPPDCDEATE